MGITTSIMESQEIHEFRKLTSDPQLQIPAPSTSRYVTDKKGFMIFGIVFVVFVPFLIYTLVKSDLRRLSHGYDDCGNYCGIKNTKIDGLNCSGEDYTDKPYKWIDIREDSRSCSGDCPPGDIQKNGQCYDPKLNIYGTYNTTVENLWDWEYTQKSWWKFVVMVVTTIVLSLFILVLYRYVPEVMVWGILIISILATLGVTSVSWYGYSTMNPNDETRGALLAAALLLTVFSIIILILIAVLFKKIKLIVLLYKETAKAIFAMPLLTVLPIITIFFQFAVLSLLIITTVWMTSSAELVEIAERHYDYIRNGAMTFALTFNFLISIWALQFFAGCQYMVSAGSVASWYFSGNNRLYLKSPIWTSFTNTMKFHLGTIAYGSFILTIVAVIKAIIRSLISNNKIRWIVDCCCNNIEAFLKFLSKNSYIETALHGQSFCRSGKRAAQLLITNASSVIALNSVGDFVLGMTEFLLFCVCTGISYALFSDNPNWWFPTIVSAIVNIIIIIIVFAVFETTVDTLFICFCEDKVINDGMSKPYFMSTGLMQFVENSKKVYKERK